MADGQPADEGTSGAEPMIGEIPGTLTHGGRFTRYNFVGHIFEVTSKYKSPKPIGQGAFGLIIALRDVIPPPERGSFNDVYIVYELMETDLLRVMESKQPLSQDHLQLFLYYILHGLKYMHSANVLHRDLKPSNILVNANCDLKICDFGMARVKSDSMTQHVVTRWYRAPEILLDSSDYTAAIDVWSVGCIFVELLQGEALFQGRHAANQLRLQLELLGTPSEAELSHLNEPTCAAPFDFAFERDMLTQEQFKDLVYQECLALNPEHRAT